MNTLRSLLEHAARIALDFSLMFVRNPDFVMRSQELRLKHRGNLCNIAARYGLQATTLQGQLAKGLDNPAYRFHRDAEFWKYFSTHAAEFRGCSWLDVGADTGAVTLYLSELLSASNFELCDVSLPRQSNFPVCQFDGRHLGYADKSFDLVILSYVLHHAGDDTIPLLRDAARIARKYVIVTEDPKETDDDCRWAYLHDKRGTFRGRREWQDLFSMLGFSISHEAALDDKPHSRHFFLLRPSHPN